VVSGQLVECSLYFVLSFLFFVPVSWPLLEMSALKSKKAKSKEQSSKYKVQKATDHEPLTTDSFFLIKLLQKPHVVLEQETNVIQFVHQSAHAVDAESKGKAGKFFRIDTGAAQNVRMDHARPAQFDPA
jgi:hypothetical protein